MFLKRARDRKEPEARLYPRKGGRASGDGELVSLNQLPNSSALIVFRTECGGSLKCQRERVDHSEDQERMPCDL